MKVFYYAVAITYFLFSALIVQIPFEFPLTDKTAYKMPMFIIWFLCIPSVIFGLRTIWLPSFNTPWRLIERGVHYVIQQKLLIFWIDIRTDPKCFERPHVLRAEYLKLRNPVKPEIKILDQGN